MGFNDKGFTPNYTVTKSITISNVSTTIVQQNLKRTSLTLFNQTGAKIYFCYGATCVIDEKVTGVVKPDEAWTMPFPLFLGAISAVKPTGTGNLIITETTLQVGKIY